MPDTFIANKILIGFVIEFKFEKLINFDLICQIFLNSNLKNFEISKLENLNNLNCKSRLAIENKLR